MISFESKFFQKFNFTAKQLKQYFVSAERDFAIAVEDIIPEVRFKFAYDAVIKTGIFLIAQAGYKVHSQTGHHVRILEKLSEILDYDDVTIMGNIMRQKRNRDLYDGGTIITETEAMQYVEFAGNIIKKAKNKLKN